MPAPTIDFLTKLGTGLGGPFSGLPSYDDLVVSASSLPSSYPLGNYDGWCADANVPIYQNTIAYRGTIYSSYEYGVLLANPAFATLGTMGSGAVLGTVPADMSSHPYLANLDIVNWLLGHIVVNGTNDGYTVTGTGIPPTGPFTRGDVQESIWQLLGDGWTANTFTGPYTMGQTTALVNYAITQVAALPGGTYVPDAGEKLAVILDVRTQAPATPDLVRQATMFVTQAAKLGDFVWNDINANGLQDPGEPGIAGATVKLVRDLNNDTDFNDLNEILATTTTDANGLYAFKGLTPGLDYTVLFDMPAGYNGVSPYQVGGAAAGNNSDGLQSSTVTLAPGEYNSTIDSGFYKTAALGDRLWEDTDADGIQDPGEPGIPGQTVTLTSGGANGDIGTGGDDITTTTTTDANGLYSFTGLTPGQEYQVTFTKPSGTTFTQPDAPGSTDSNDSDVNQTTGKTPIVTLVSGENNLTLDAGVVSGTGGLRLVKATNAVDPLHPTPAEDANTPPGLAIPVGNSVVWTYNVFNTGTTAVPVTSLVDDHGTPQTITDDFNPVQVLSGGFNVGDADTDNLVDPGEVWLYTSSGVVSYTAQKGLAELAPSLSFGWTQAGSYALLGLAGGTVIVNSATTVTGDFGYSSGVTSNTNQKITTWTSGTAYVSSGVSSFNYTPATYQPPGGIVTNATQDARLVTANTEALAASAQLGALTTTINLGTINDTSASAGVVNGVANLNVVKIDSLDMKSDILTLTGDASDYFVINVLGDFKFAQSEVQLIGGVTANHVIWNFPVLPGSHVIDLDKAENIFNGTILAPDDAVGYHNPATFNGAIIAKDINVHSDFNLNWAPFYPQYTNVAKVTSGSQSDTDPSSNHGVPPPPLVAPLSLAQSVVQTGSIGSLVWCDSNANGVQDRHEAGVAGVTVKLLDATGAVLGTTTTDNAGQYLFAELQAGDYQVQVVKPAAFASFTSANQGSNDALDSDVGSTGFSSLIALAAGVNDSSVDAGLTPRANRVVTPLAIDLGADGLKTIALADSTGKFDLFGNGSKVKSGWLANDDAFLAIDSNHNGKIDSILELFGGNQPGQGFAELIAFDSNGDLVVNASDAHYRDLSVWRDSNGNHHTDAGELISLASAGVVSLSVDYDADSTFWDAQGNLHLDQSSATLENGQVVDLTDIAFAMAANDVGSRAALSALSAGYAFA